MKHGSLADTFARFHKVGYFPKPSLEGQPGILRLPRVVLASDKVLQRSTANV